MGYRDDLGQAHARLAHLELGDDGVFGASEILVSAPLFPGSKKEV